MENNQAPTLAKGKICYLEIPTTHINRSISFYQQVFGWNIRHRSDGSIAFDDPTGEVSGSWVTGRKIARETGLLIYIFTDNISATMQAISVHGGRITQPVGADAPEITARFSDPDGNILGLYQPPYEFTEYYL